MMSPTNKTKQFLTVSLKIAVVSLAIGFTIYKLQNSNISEIQEFALTYFANLSPLLIVLLVYLSFQNRFLEIVKWQNLASTIKPLSIHKSAEEVFAAFTLGSFTPNGLGEYAGKALFYPPNYRLKIVALNLVCNGIQMFYSVFFGLLAFAFLGIVTLLQLVSILAATLVLFFILRKLSSRFQSKINDFFKAGFSVSASVHKRNFLYGFLRYATFTSQYVLFLYVANSTVNIISLFAAVTATYLLASSLPAFQLFDFAVKTGVALLFFSELGINPQLILLVTLLMWLLNVVVPLLIGTVYVLRFKPEST